MLYVEENLIYDTHRANAYPPHETCLNHTQQIYRFYVSPIDCTS